VLQRSGSNGFTPFTVATNFGGGALIPSTANRKIQHTVDKAIYAPCNRIERFFNRLKNSRWVATDYDKLIECFAAFVILATIRTWISFVHATNITVAFFSGSESMGDLDSGSDDWWRVG
jgi:hypothetical protein